MKKLIVALLSVFLLMGCVQKTANVIQNVELGNLEEKIVSTIEEVEKSTFLVKVYRSTQLIGYGSGFVYKICDGFYYLLTNEHVIENGTSFKVSDIKNDYNANLIGHDNENDLAVLTFQTENTINPLPLKNDNVLKKGQHVIAIGTPLSEKYFNTATVGIISNYSSDFIQHDAAINPGNSGGPLFDLNGTVIGVNVKKTAWADSSKDTPIEGLGFSISIDTVLKLIDKLDGKNVPINRPVLGITIETLSHYLTDSLNDVSFIPEGLKNGLLIKVVELSSVSIDFLFVNDIIVRANDVEINNTEDLSAVLKKLNIRDKIVFDLYRNKELVKVSFVL